MFSLHVKDASFACSENTSPFPILFKRHIPIFVNWGIGELFSQNEEKNALRKQNQANSVHA
jgi:hypothetical protein